MVCTLVIDGELLRNPLCYKYVIYSPKVTKENEYYEKLHPFINPWYPDDPNRVLQLSAEDYCFASEGMLQIIGHVWISELVKVWELVFTCYTVIGYKKNIL